MKSKDVSNVIIGGGLTGLSTAYHLNNDDYFLLEKNDRIGGLCRSITVDGFTFDHSIHILFSKDKAISSLIQDILLKDNLLAQQRESWIYSKGVYTEFPFQANTYGLPPDVILECVMGLIKAKYEDGKPKQPENFRDWIYDTFGEGIAKHFMIPYNKKVWAIDPAMMDFKWIAERVPQPDIESTLLGAIQPPYKKIGFNNDFWYPVEGGIEALPKGFLPFITNIKLNSRVTKIFADRHRLIVTEDGKGEFPLNFDNIVSTIPLPSLIRLLDEVPDKIRKASLQLLHNNVYVVNIGVEDEIDPVIRQNLHVNPRKFHWIYIPEERYTLHRLSFPKNLSPNTCPQGMSSIQVEISSSDFRPIDMNSLCEVVVGELQHIGILQKNNKIVLKNLMILNPAYVIYDLNHSKNVKFVIDFLKQKNIYPCGRFGQWEYLNMDHSILCGKKAAEWIHSQQSVVV